MSMLGASGAAAGLDGVRPRPDAVGDDEAGHLQFATVVRQVQPQAAQAHLARAGPADVRQLQLVRVAHHHRDAGAAGRPLGVADDQFDECDITLRDIELIREAFITQLQGVYHQRVPYPQNKIVELESRREAS